MNQVNRFQQPTYGTNAEYHPANGVVLNKSSTQKANNMFWLLRKQQEDAKK